MTERPSRIPRLPLRTAIARVGLVSVAAALMLMGGLWLQLALGNDPALAPKAAATERSAPAQIAGSVAPAASVAPPPVGDSTAVAPAVSPASVPAPAPVQTATS